MLSNANSERCHCYSKYSKMILMMKFEMTDRRRRRTRRPKVVPTAATEYV